MFEDAISMRAVIGSTWVTVAILAGYLLFLVLRNDGIRSRGLFMFAGILLALSIALPPFLASVATFFYQTPNSNFSMSNSQRFGARGSGNVRTNDIEPAEYLQLASSLSGPLLLGAGFLFAMMSVLPKRAQPAMSRGPASNTASGRTDLPPAGVAPAQAQPVENKLVDAQAVESKPPESQPKPGAET